MLRGSELETCLTQVLERMEVSDEMVDAFQVSPATSQVSPQSRSLVGVVQVAGVVIALAPIVLVAGGVTILVGVSIFVVEEVAEALRRRKKWENECQRKLTECLLSSLGSRWGDVYGTSRCAMCFKQCDENGWPSGITIDDDVFATCNYLGN